MSANDLIKQIRANLDALAAILDPYNGGLVYPAAVTVDIPAAIAVQPGVKQLLVPVTLSGPTANTACAHSRAFNGKGGTVADAIKPVFFRPGDPLTKTVAFDVKAFPAGATINIAQAVVPDGASPGNRSGVATATAGTPDQIAAPDMTPVNRFAPVGAPAYAPAVIPFDDNGGPGVWSTALSHGRTQVGNGETGYYGTVAMGAVSQQADGLHLRTAQLDTPVQTGSPPTSYPHMAANISAHKTPETWFTYGSFETVAKLPNAPGAWVSIWLLPADGGWPPEIDVFEAWMHNASWMPSKSLSCTLHGGPKGTGKWSRSSQTMTMLDLGLPATLDSDFHAYQCTVSPEWIIVFMDGIERFRFANPFAGTQWYPIINCGVKWPGVYAGGDLVVKLTKVWRTA